jgi:hypothetical protein
MSKNAYTISQQPYVLSLEIYAILLKIPYNLRRNNDFIVALREAMNLLRYNVLLGYKGPANVVITDKTQYSK